MSDPVLTLDNIFKIVEIIAIIGGGGAVSFKLGRASQAVTSSTTRFEEGMLAQSAEIKELREEIKTLSKLVTEVAVQNTRLDGVDRRIDGLERKQEELARGEGFVLPLEDALRKRLPR